MEKLAMIELGAEQSGVGMVLAFGITDRSSTPNHLQRPPRPQKSGRCSMRRC